MHIHSRNPVALSIVAFILCVFLSACNLESAPTSAPENSADAVTSETQPETIYLMFVYTSASNPEKIEDPTEEQIEQTFKRLTWDDPNTRHGLELRRISNGTFYSGVVSRNLSGANGMLQAGFDSPDGSFMMYEMPNPEQGLEILKAFHNGDSQCVQQPGWTRVE